MSKYKLGVFPQDQYRFRIFDNTAKLKDWPEIMTAAGPDCVAAMNLAYFALSAVPAQGIRAILQLCGVVKDPKAILILREYTQLVLTHSRRESPARPSGGTGD